MDSGMFAFKVAMEAGVSTLDGKSSQPEGGAPVDRGQSDGPSLDAKTLARDQGLRCCANVSIRFHAVRTSMIDSQWDR